MRRIVMMNWLSAAALIILLSANPTAGDHETQSKLEIATSLITADNLKQHIDILADDTFEGRGAGTRGGRAAAGYIREKLEAMGLRPLGAEDAYRQPFGNNCQNLLALVPGSDSSKNEEYILIGAHYDHVGYGTRRNSYGPTGYIHNGADDNASGTSALLEIAKALTHNPCRRNVVIAFWDGEEQGLLGSKYFINNPTVSLDHISMMVNMDMVGRLRENTLTLYGTRTWSGSRAFISNVNSFSHHDAPLSLDFNWEIKANSDHHPFFKRHIPYIMPHTGLHDDYHRPRDDAHKINSAGTQTVTRFIYRLLIELDQREQIPAFRTYAKAESPKTKQILEQSLAPTPKRLGLSWSSSDSAIDGLTVERVHRNSPAARAQIRRGDKIISLDGREVRNDDEMRAAVFLANSECEIEILPHNEELPITKPILLRGKPHRIGLSWRLDQAESDTAMISRVLPGSPAEKAGLICKDRIHAINGIPWPKAKDVENPFAQRALPLNVTVERNGRLITLDIQPFRVGSSQSASTGPIPIGS